MIEQYVEGNRHIIGLTLESFLQGGDRNRFFQKETLLERVSITDPCLDWASTEELILWAAKEYHEAGPMVVSWFTVE